MTTYIYICAAKCFLKVDFTLKDIFKRLKNISHKFYLDDIVSKSIVSPGVESEMVRIFLKSSLVFSLTDSGTSTGP